jgi:hypothetical protein
MWQRKTGLLLIVLYLCCGLRAKAATPVILSTDVGNEIDDQWAVAYTLANPEFEVLGSSRLRRPQSLLLQLIVHI